MPQTLIYLSSCALAADGKTDPFMMQEHPWLLKRFNRVEMVSYYGVKTLSPDDGDYLVPEKPGFAGLRAWAGLPFSRDLWRELGRLRRDGKLTPVAVIKLLLFAQRGRKMHFWTERLLQNAPDGEITLYACWMSFDGYAAALSKQKHPRARFVVRGHAFDIDLERNPMNPYLMKQRIAEEADGVYLISDCARAQYMAYMEGRVPPEKVHVLAMGSGGEPLLRAGEAPRFADGVLRVASCAKIIEIKQVPLLVDALASWTGGPISWTHIGGGEGEAALRELAAQKLDRKENVIYEITGFMDGKEVQTIYDTRAFDVFVNTSRKEGVPVSIMEAMRHGVPVIAPEVGGIPELVGERAGWLYPPQNGAAGVLQALERLAAQTKQEAEDMREAARARWTEGYCSQNLLPSLFPEKAQSKGRVLIVSYYFAPQNTIGAVRPTKFAKYLTRMGYEVTVLCGQGMTDARDPTLASDLQALRDVRVVREWNPLREYKARKKRGSEAREGVGEAPAAKVPGTGGSPACMAPGMGEPSASKASNMAASPAPRRISPKSLIRRAANALYLGLWVLSDKSFQRRAKRELNRLDAPYDAVFSTYAPLSVHEIAREAKRRGLARRWIADFRDEASVSFGWQKPYLRRYRAMVEREADVVSAVSDGFLEMMGFEAFGRVLSNGFDREDIARLTPERGEGPRRFRAVYCGQFRMGRRGVPDRDLTPIFRVLRELIDEGACEESELSLVYAGDEGQAFSACAAACGLAGRVEDHGRVGRDESLALQKGADALLMASWNLPGQTGILTGKLFEYMMMDKPIVCCVAGDLGGSELGRVLAQTGMGFCYEQASAEADGPALREYLRTLISRWRQEKALLTSKNEAETEAFAYPKLAGKLAGWIENTKTE